ncbi:MAG: AI-2E family transporter [Bacteroidota bacterium]
MTTKSLPFYIRYTIVVICLVFTVILMRGASSLLIPLFAGLLLAILLLPVVKFLERLRVGRGPSAFLAVLCFILLFSVVNYFLTTQISGFAKEMPGIIDKIRIVFASFQQWITQKFHVNSAQQSDYINSSFNDMLNGLSGFLYRLFFSLGNIVIWILFVCIYAFFILCYRNLLVRFVMKLVGKEFPEQMPVILGEHKNVIKSYITGLLAEFLIMLVLISSVLLLLGIKYALLLAIITALLNIIPYIGIYTATALSMLVTYANSSGSAAITVGIVLLAIHLVDGIILLPRIVGSRMRINPFMMIIAVIVGDIVWGIPGMFLFIPLAAMLKIVFENISSLEAWAILFGEEIRPNKKKRV